MRFRRILCVVLAMILAVSIAVTSAFAASSFDGAATGGGRYEVKDYTWGDSVVKYAVTPIFDILNGVWDGANGFVQNVTGDLREEVQASVLDGIEFWKDIVDALSYDEYVSTLDTTTAFTSIALSGFTVSALADSSSGYSSGAFNTGIYADNASNAIQCFSNALSQGKYVVYASAYSSNGAVLAAYGIYNGRYARLILQTPYSVSHCSYLGVIDSDVFPVIAGRYLYFSKNDLTPVFPSCSAARSYFGSDWLTSSYYVADVQDVIGFSDNTYGSIRFSRYLKKSASNSVEIGVSSSVSFSFASQIDWMLDSDGVYFSGSSYWPTFYGAKVGYVDWGESHVVSQPSGVDSTSRSIAFANSIVNYNSYNFYGDDATVVNYYIGTTDSSGNLTGIYNFGVFDEDSMIFRDPETGTEYQAVGWSYDYTTRTYDIAFDAGTLTVNDADITQVLLTYGDEALTIRYYDAAGDLIDTRTYVYLQVAQSDCAINGHIYTYETVQEATCTSVGERKYTCSVCGNEYPEEIPMTEHTYTYEVQQEPSCTVPGIGLYTCSVCGSQKTEQIDELGHDWLATEVTETAYRLPEGTSCPDCGGTEFAVELDKDNGVYTCTCSDCGAVWEVSAEITYGQTTYTCSRCGETYVDSDNPESGLFAAIGNLLADTVTWVTDKLSQLVDSLSGLNDTFQDYMEQVKESGGEYPAFLAAFVAMMPDDLMTVLWFCLIALLVLAVWKKWFS